MTAKGYLSQAKYLDEQIKNKIKQLDVLNDMATNVTAKYSDMPRGSNTCQSKQDSVVTKIIDFQNEINRDIDALVDLKRAIYQKIQQVSNMEYRIILERRYLCFETWEQIAVDMDYSIQHVHRLHNSALQKITIFLKDETKCY